MRNPTGLVVFIAAWGFAVLVIGQEQRQVELLSQIELKAHVLKGAWSQTEEGLQANSPSGRALCVVPYELSDSYQLSFEFTRTEGNDVIGIILPLAKSQVFLGLSGWDGKAHGLSRINQLSTLKDGNPTAVRPGKLQNGKRYRVVAKVTPQGDSVAITVRLNDQELIDWTGAFGDIEPNLVHRIKSFLRPALVTNKGVAIFHSLSVRHKAKAGKPVEVDLSEFRSKKPLSPPKIAPVVVSGPIMPGTVDLTTVQWKEQTGTLNIVDFQGDRVVQLIGSNDKGVALLPGVEFSDGVVEVDIAAGTFSGLAVRAADASNYDLLYFRPQNSGTTKHKNSVQYVSKGRAGADWRTLRTKYPGKYEAGADLKMNQWFHATIVLKGESLTVYVDDVEQPCLVVEKMLGERASGKIGIWGWRSQFRNFSFKPSKTK